MSARRFCEWKEYYDLEPIGDERADMRIALLTCNVVAALTGQRLKIGDCQLSFTPKKGQTAEEMKLLLRIYTGE